MSGEHRTTNIVLPYRRALVTGATGFIGAHLARALVDRGVETAVLTRQTTLPQHLRDLDGTVRVQRGNLLDTTTIERLIADFRPEAIFHLAAYGTHPHERDMPQMLQVNVHGTANLLAAVAKVPCAAFVHAGSLKEYRESAMPITEESELGPRDAYGVSKVCTTFLCRFFAEQYGVPTTILRLAPAYGPWDADHRFIPTAIRAALTGAPLPLAAGAARRGFTYADDVADAFLRASARRGSAGEIVNIGMDAQVSYEELLGHIERLTGTHIIRAPWTGGDETPARAFPEGWVLDTTKARTLLGWKARTSLSEGLQRTVAWTRERVQ